MFMRLAGWDPPTLHYYSAKFGGYRYYGSADINKVYHLSRNNVVKKSGESGTFTLRHHHARFDGSRSYGSGDVIFPIPIPIPMASSNAKVYKWPNL